MAINFSAYAEQAKEREAAKEFEDVKRNYFQLQDGESKTVVINFDPGSEKVVNVHNYFAKGNSNKIKCLGANCPMCEKARSFGKDEVDYFKVWASPRVFLQVFDEAGVEYVWERTFNFVQGNIVPLIENLGDLGKVFVTVTRKGTGTSTTYNIQPKLKAGSVAKVPEDLLDKIAESPRNDSNKGLYLDLGDRVDMIRDFLETGVLSFGIKAENYEEKEEYKAVDDSEVPF